MNRNPTMPTTGTAEGDRETVEADLREDDARTGGHDAATSTRSTQDAGSDRAAGNPDSGPALPTPGKAEGGR